MIMSLNIDQKEINISPVKNSVIPAFKITLQIKHNSFIIPIIINGKLYSEKNLLISATNISTFASKITTGSLARLYAKGTRFDKEAEKIKTMNVNLTFFLSREAINHLEQARRANPKRDVVLRLELEILSIASSTEVFHAFLIDNEKAKKLGLPIPEVYTSRGPRGGSYVVYSYDPEYGSYACNLWILSGSGSPSFLNFYKHTFNFNLRIPYSDWIHEFAPVFRIGEFFVIELPVIKEAVTDQLKKALSELEYARKFMAEGRDFEALNCVRNAIMNCLLTKKEEKMQGTQKVVERHFDDNLVNYILSITPQNIEDQIKREIKAMEKILRKLLNECISNFIHLETGKRLATPLRADVEYAYLVTLSCTKYLIDLIKSFEMSHVR